MLNEGIFHEFPAPLTPEKSEVDERKNITLQEMALVMLYDKSLPLYFWTEVLNTVYHIHSNHISLHPGMSFTNYQLWNGCMLNIRYFHVFDSTYYILGKIGSFIVNRTLSQMKGCFLVTLQIAELSKCLINATELLWSL